MGVMCKPRICNFCPIILDGKRKMQHHSLGHFYGNIIERYAEIKFHECVQCLKYVDKPSKLFPHLAFVHDIVSEFCGREELCGLELTKEQVNEHNIVIRESKKYKKDKHCSACGYAARYESQVKYHIKVVHLKDNLTIRDKHCHLCSYSTNNVTHLKRHLSDVHMQERNHPCKFCNLRFAQEGNLMKHTKRKHLKDIKKE